MADKDFAECMSRMVKEEGKEILLNGKAKNLIADYCGSGFRAEANIFRLILDEGCGSLINDALNVLECKKLLVKRMEDNCGISPKYSTRMLDMLGFMLRGDSSKCEIETGFYNKSEPVTQTQIETDDDDFDDEDDDYGIYDGSSFTKKAGYTDSDLIKRLSAEKLLVWYDFIDNGNGELALVMYPPEGDADDEDAVFVHDGVSKAYMIRSDKQVIYLPVSVDKVLNLLKKIDKVLVVEMGKDKCTDAYDAEVKVINPLPAAINPRQIYSNEKESPATRFMRLHKENKNK